MFKPQLRPTEVAQVGNYAIRFNWNDGHQHGIFSWDYLREWCPCQNATPPATPPTASSTTSKIILRETNSALE